MATVTMRDILASLPTLPPDDLSSLRARAGALLQLGGHPTTGDDAPGPVPRGPVASDARIKRYAAVIVDALQDTGMSVSMPRVEGCVATSIWVDRVTMIENYLRPSALDVPSLVVVVRLGVRLLMANMQKMKVPITPRSLVTQLHRVPPMLDLEFPGYATMGLLGILTRAKLVNGSHVAG